MDVIYALVPGMIFLGLIMVGVLIWAVKNGQYDDLEGDAHRFLMDDDDAPQPSGKRRRRAGRARPAAPTKEAGKNWPDAD